MLKKLIYLSFIVGLTACGGGTSDMEACAKNTGIYMVDQFAPMVDQVDGLFTPEEVEKNKKEMEKTKKDIMSMSLEDFQKTEMGKTVIDNCEKAKAEQPDAFKKIVKGDFSDIE